MKKADLMNNLCIHENSIAHLKFSAQWQNDGEKHTAIHHVEKFNVWRDMDLLPQPLMNDILHHPVGKGDSHSFCCGEIVPLWKTTKLIKLPLKNFTGRLNGVSIKPRAGRFYPKGWISGVNGIYSENMFPVRVAEVKDNEFIADYNHPLASQDISLDVEIIEIFPPTDEHGGRCIDIIQEFLCNGPGMQMPFMNKSTDFFVNKPFDRIDESDDDIFYKKDRMVHHLDANARHTIKDIYSNFIKSGSRVLDLMSSWESHIPENINDSKIYGLGMNENELKANTALDDYIVHDLNKNPSIPYEDNSFDVVICTASVEYLINPIPVFNEIRRVLNKGGQCVITFSNRWFPSKSILHWSELHEFERIGLVMEYFKQSNWKGVINTLTSRGLHRPVDDPHYAQIQTSDPVYAVWCQK